MRGHRAQQNTAMLVACWEGGRGHDLVIRKHYMKYILKSIYLPEPAM